MRSSMLKRSEVFYGKLRGGTKKVRTLQRKSRNFTSSRDYFEGMLSHRKGKKYLLCLIQLRADIGLKTKLHVAFKM